MPVTEFVFPHPNPDPVLFEKLRQVLPTAAKATFANVPGLFATYRGKIIKAQNISEGKNILHSGLIIVLGNATFHPTRQTKLVLANDCRMG